HHVLSAQSLDTLLERIADTLSDLMPYEALHVYEANEERRELIPVLARSDSHHEEIMQSRPGFGEGITGWAVENRSPVWTHLAQTDSLTGLYNHRFFHERLRSELTRASRSHDPVAVLMFDLDDFKRVNDVYGHGAGDQLLLQVSRLALETVRGSDVVCRIGGEEFGVIMPSCDAGDALGLAARLTERLREVEFEPAGRVTVSIGISQGPQHAMNPRELVACAEASMMTAKA